MNTEAPALTDQQREALDVAKAMAAAGIPIFIAQPDATAKTGYRPPRNWERTVADPAVVDQWRPGLALCAVMGCGLDLTDIDPRNGGDVAQLNGSTPRVYGVVATPSGGTHLFIRSLGTGSRDNVFPGIDVKSGTPDGRSRGFAFLPPTVRTSVTTSEPVPYRWQQPLDLTALDPTDTSGDKLAARIRELRAGSGVRRVGGPDWWQAFVASKEPQAALAADRAIIDKLAEVREWTAESGTGFRHVLLRAALTLGGYVGSGYLDEQDARERLHEAVCAIWGTPDNDDLLWIQQGLDDGAVQPFHVYTAEDELLRGEAYATAAADGPPPWTIYTAIGLDPFDPRGGTDQEMAEAVLARMYPGLRYSADAGTWLIRGPRIWREREDLSGWATSTLARVMPLGDPDLPKKKEDYTAEHWTAARRLRFMSAGSAAPIEKKMRALVRGGDHPATIELGRLDAHPEVLWAGDVPWDLRASGNVPTPADLDPATPHLHTASCTPAGIPTPHWDAFVEAVWPELAIRAWALRVLSIALAGYPDAALPVLYGPERTGKTALISLIVKALGSYGHAADPRLLGGADNTHASVVYALKGRRLSFIDEGPRRGHLAAERLKQLTGGGALTGNAMRSNPVTFNPTHTLVMTTNDEPPITDPALRARVRLIPCEADQATVRAARLAITSSVWRQEAPGVLATLMRECAAWLDDPDSALTSRAPADLQRLADDMAERQSPIGEWIENCTVPADPGTPGRELYVHFVQWHQNSPLYRRASVPTETAFGRKLTEKGYPPSKSGKSFRPLSVLSGPAGVAPWEPMPSEHMTRGRQPDVDSKINPGGFAGGFWRVPDPQPSKGENPRSTPVFSSSLDGLEGTSCSIEESKEKSPKRGTPVTGTPGNGGQTLHPPDSPKKTGVDLGKLPRRMVEGKPSNPLLAQDGPDAGETTQDSSLSVIYSGDREGLSAAEIKTGLRELQELGVPVTDAQERDLEEAKQREARAAARQSNAEVARRAAESGLSKTEARAQLKAEQRQAAIREAAGEVLTLPAVVDRSGNVLPLTLEQATSVVRAAAARSGALTVDVETSGYPVGHTDYELRSVQLGDETAAVVFHPVDHAELVRTLLAEAPHLHAHSATADLIPLAHAGLIEPEAAWERMHDTVIPAKLADPASTGSDPGLKQLAGAVLGDNSVAPAADAGRARVFKAGRWLEKTKVDTPIEKSGWAQIDTGSITMLRYAASDVLDTAALARSLPRPAPHVYERERLAQRMTARVTHRGVRLDPAHIAELTEQHTSGRAAAATRVRAFGIDNPGSDQQVGQALEQRGADLPRTATGRPSVAVGVLEPMKETEGPIGDLVRAVLDYRHHDTALGLFLEPYRQLCERGDGRARPTVYTLGTDTGRMSCTRPNLQQLPREGGMRACITADPGQLMIGADFSGVEIRVAAALSQDPTLLQFLADDRDLHWEVARMVYGPDATKAHRYRVKRGVFGRLYGGGVPTLAMQMGVAQSEARRVVDALDALTPQLSAWSHSVREAVKRGRTQFPSYSGRVIHLPLEFPHKGPNYCIQGTARELLVDALLRWRDTRWGTAILVPVHDELDVFVPADEADEATRMLVECMETDLFGIKIISEPSTPSSAWQDSA